MTVPISRKQAHSVTHADDKKDERMIIQAGDIVFIGGIVWGEGRVSFISPDGKTAAVILNSGAVFARVADLEFRSRPE